jgi:hypothetical protein
MSNQLSYNTYDYLSCVSNTMGCKNLIKIDFLNILYLKIY